MADLDSLAHVALQVALLVHDFHRPPAQHVARPHDQRITQRRRFFQGFWLGTRGGVGRLAQFERMQQLLEPFTVFGRIDHVRRGANDRHAIGFQVQRQLQRCLAAILNNHAPRLFLVNDFQHVFQRQGLKIQPVRRVVVGRDRFRVAVDHDGLVAIFPQGQRRVHAAIVKLDALTNAVRSAAQHHDFFLVRRFSFAFTAGVESVR